MKTTLIKRLLTSIGIGLSTACAAETSDRPFAERLTGVEPPSTARSFSEWSWPVSVGDNVNTTAYNEQQPAVSKDGLSLYFQSNRPEFEGDLTLDGNIWVSQRACDECPWGPPFPLPRTINGPANDVTPDFSRDGHWLFFASNRVASQGNDIFASYRENVHDDLGWGEPQNVGTGVNTRVNENGPSYFANEDLGAPQLFFTRQSGPTMPSGDLFVSELQPDGSWGQGVRLDVVNSAYADQRSSLTPDGLTMYFWSTRPVEGATPAAGYIWESARASTAEDWSQPTRTAGGVGSRSSVQPFIYRHGRTETLFYVHNNGTTSVNFDIVWSQRVRGGKP